MRKIKFRAWDKIDKQMYYAIENGIQFDDGSSYEFRNFLTPDYHDCHKWEIMQYTGLQDKNKKEIYEGDIVEIVNDKNKKVANEPYQFKYGDIAKVEWNNVNLAYYLVNENLEEVEVQMDYYGAWSDWNWLKVIGNIYENPELLK